MDKFNVEHLDLYYGDFKALKDINLKLPANEITSDRPAAVNQHF